MEINLYLLLSLLIALLVISYLLGKLHRVRGQLFLISIAEFVLTSPKAGFGEAPQQAFLQPAGMKK